MSTILRYLRLLVKYKRALIIVLTPLVIIPIPAVLQTKEALASYILLLMAVYWVTEVIPLGVTAIIPMVLTPVFGILSSKKLCPVYMKDTNVLFMGGLMVATAVEKHNLHKRIALASLMVMGTSPRRLMLGFMVPTWFLSMWISNTATTAMMLPIVDAVLQEIQQCAEKPPTSTEIEMEEQPLDDKNGEVEVKPRPAKSEHVMNLKKAMSICIAYAASCGGIGTLTGTGPNLVLNNLITSNYGSNAKFGFGIWMIYAIPISFVSLMCVWTWLQLYFLGIREFFKCRTDKEAEASVKNVIRQKYRALGPISWPEGSCLFFFCLLVFLWVSKSPGVDGWVRWFKNSKGDANVSDAQPAIFVALLLFMWPSRNPFRKRDEYAIEMTEEEKEKKNESLLTWETVQLKFPWSIVLLLGGGYALAKTCEKSGLSVLIGAKLVGLSNLPVAVLIIVITLASAFFTEFTSNTATASIIMPILNQLAKCINLHPFVLILPATVACSLAFCLPVATPPNAIVFAKGYLTVWDMMRCGFFLNFICVFVVTAGTLSYAVPFFDLYSFPEWVGGCTLNGTAS